MNHILQAIQDSIKRIVLNVPDFIKKWKSPIFYVVAGLAAFMTLQFFMSHMSDFFEIVAAFAIVSLVALALIDLYERNALYKLHAEEQLKENNIAVAIYYVSFSIRILAIAIVLLGALIFI